MVWEGLASLERADTPGRQWQVQATIVDFTPAPDGVAISTTKLEPPHQLPLVKVMPLTRDR